MSEAQLDWLQDHLRILSGLYGLLRPLDLMRPYRLEMGTNSPTPPAGFIRLLGRHADRSAERLAGRARQPRAGQPGQR